MTAVAFEVLVILSLILINGLFALAEIGIVSSRRARLQRMADKGIAGAKNALQLAEFPADFLSTVQVGITLIGVLSGAFAGATIAEQLADVFSEIVPATASYAETIAIGIVVLAITFFSLILGELVPKRIALHNPEKIAMLVARPMQLLSKITLPAVHIVSLSTNAVLWLLRAKPSTEPSITEDEVRILVRQGTIAGVFEKGEQEMIDRVFRLSSLRLPAIMTPRTEVVALYLTDSVEVIAGKIKVSGHSQFPVCDGSLDNIVGMAPTRTLLVECLLGRRFDLRSCVQEVLNIPESATALIALDRIKKTDSRAALVIDEFGGLQGLVTISDFMGSILGLLPEGETPRIITRKDGSLLIDGLLPIDDLLQVAEFRQLNLGRSLRYSTVGGFVLTRIGRIPSAGDAFEIGEYRFEVIGMDGLRVDKILIAKVDLHNAISNSP